MSRLLSLSLLATFALAGPAQRRQTSSTASAATSVCTGNTAEDRSVWCDYDINTDYYKDGPTTGVTREYWFELTNTTLAPDGVERRVLAVNGTVPGPTIEANWGDTVVIHVHNGLENNGTGIHWHGIRQNYTNLEDGVPSITQCPVAPGESMTYTWKASQYGMSWYHSHYSLQAWEGVLGPMVIYGPHSANYDVDLGPITLVDWSHTTADELYSYAQTKGPPLLQNALINGVNTYGDGGARYETVFESGTRYLLRIVNTAIDTHFKFSIDNHTMTVVSADFVPIEPYQATVLDINMGQRYEVIVEADQDGGNYWMRAVPQAACSANNNTNNIKGIVRYDASSTEDPATPLWLRNEVDSCVDELSSNLVPIVRQTVGEISNRGGDENLGVAVGFVGDLFKWRIGSTSMAVEWEEPSVLQVHNNDSDWTNTDAILELNEPDQWVYFVIETTLAVPHPMHLHGHDFVILASEAAATWSSETPLNFDNPPRRDVATLPAAGYLVLAFQTDNPGAWLMHCHIGWHTSQGLALQFIERFDDMQSMMAGKSDTLTDTCAAWNDYVERTGLEEEDSGV